MKGSIWLVGVLTSGPAFAQSSRAATPPAVVEPATSTPAASSAPPSESAPPTVATPPAEAAPVVFEERRPPADEEPLPDDYREDRLSPGPSVDHDKSEFLIAGSWDMTQPVGSSTDFINVFGVQGASFQARYQGLGRLSLGLMASWQTWSNKSDQTIVQDNVTLGGTQVRAIAVNPLYARVQYALFDIRAHSSEMRPVPYAAFNLGGARTLRQLDMGVSGLTQDSWHWAIAPELGLELPIRHMVVSLAGRFNYLFSSGEGPEQLYFSFSLGLGVF